MAEEELRDQADENEEAYQVASTIKRFINYLIDSTVVSIITILYMNLTGVEKVMYNPEEIDPRLSTYLLINIVLYYLVSEGIFGRTIGKVFTRTYLVDTDGYKPTFLKIVIRTLCRLIPLEAITFLFPGMNGWHDSISGTRVVEEVKN